MPTSARASRRSPASPPSGPYDIDDVWIDSYALYTNVTPSGALRGFGVPQLVWAYEGHTDMMARALKMDPVEFRRKNLMREGRPHATGQILKDAPIEKVMDKVLERMNWSQPFDKRQRPRSSAAAASPSPSRR